MLMIGESILFPTFHKLMSSNNERIETDVANYVTSFIKKCIYLTIE